MKSPLTFETSGALCLMMQIASQNLQQLGVVGVVVIDLQFDSSWLLWPMKMGPVWSPEMSVTSYHLCCATFQNSKDLNFKA